MTKAIGHCISYIKKNVQNACNKNTNAETHSVKN